VRQVDGGAPLTITTSWARLPFWAPDGRRILFLSARGIEIVPALGGASRVLVPAVAGGPIPGPIAADGRSFVFASRDSCSCGRWTEGSRGSSASGGKCTPSRGRPTAAGSPTSPVIPTSSGSTGELEYRPECDLGRARAGRNAGAGDGRPIAQRQPGLGVGRDPRLRVESRRRPRRLSGGAGALGHPVGPPLRVTTGLNAHGISASANGARFAYSAFTETSNVWSIPSSRRVSRQCPRRGR